MGFASLRLVNPVAYDPNLVEIVAHDTRDLVAGIRHFDTLAAALADCVRVAAFAGKPRAAKWRRLDPRGAAADLLEHAADGPVALLFGREDHGLPRDALDLAHVTVTIPTTAHSSLNLAQAVLVALYELHLRAGDATRTLPPPRKLAPPATSEQFERTFVDALRALESLDFFRSRNAEHVMRSVRSMTFRAAPDAREIELVRAIALEVLRTIERVRRQAAAGGPASAASPTAPADA
jgi:tRNA/rRNA methyltransferase/tRNA (cytidine32/uridine32-2'-O)-methyltransferase